MVIVVVHGTGQSGSLITTSTPKSQLGVGVGVGVLVGVGVGVSVFVGDGVGVGVTTTISTSKSQLGVGVGVGVLLGVGVAVGMYCENCTSGIHSHPENVTLYTEKAITTSPGSKTDERSNWWIWSPCCIVS